MLKEDLIRKLEEWSSWRVGGNINGDWFGGVGGGSIEVAHALTRCYMIPDGYNIFGRFDGTWEAVSPVATPFAPIEDSAPPALLAVWDRLEAEVLRHDLHYWKAKDKRSRKRAWEAEQEVAQLKVDLDMERGLFNGTFAANTLLHKRIVELEGLLKDTSERLSEAHSMHTGTAKHSRHYREQAEKMDVVIRGMRKCLSSL